MFKISKIKSSLSKEILIRSEALDRKKNLKNFQKEKLKKSFERRSLDC